MTPQGKLATMTDEDAITAISAYSDRIVSVRAGSKLCKAEEQDRLFRRFKVTAAWGPGHDEFCCGLGPTMVGAVQQCFGYLDIHLADD